MLSRFRRPGAAGQADREGRALAKLLERIIRNLGDDVNPTFDEAAIALDLLVDGELLAELPHELSIVADHGVFDVRIDGRNAIERYRDARRPSASSHEGKLLEAMLASRCSVFTVDTIEEDVGVGVSDLFGGPGWFVSDPDIARVAEEGIAFVARLLTLDDLTLTSGISLPLDDLAEEDVHDDLSFELPDRDPTDLAELTAEEAAIVAAVVWRAALDSFGRSVESLLAGVNADALLGAPEAPRLWLPGDQTADEIPIIRGRPTGPSRLNEREGGGSSIILPFSRKSAASAEPEEDHRAKVADYRRIRLRLVDLQQDVVETVSREVIQEAGLRLGLMKDGVLAVTAEHELAVLMDFAIYDVRRNGQTAVGRYYDQRGGKLPADRRTVLEAMVDNRYSILMVTRLESEVGVHCRDLLGGPDLFVYERGLSLTGQPGMIVATRLVAPEGLTMTSGAPLPFPELADENLTAFRQWIDDVPLATLEAMGLEARHEITEAIVKFALEHDAGTTILTIDPNDPDGPLGFGGVLGGRNVPRVRGKPRTSESAAHRRPKKKRRR